MPLSSETYRAIAARSAYRADSLEKVIRLGEVLREFDEDELLTRSLALRGGTAINLEQNPPPRLSVDLDFDFVGEVDRSDMLAAKPGLIAAIQQIARSLRYQVSVTKDAPAGTSLKLDYRNGSGTPDLLKLDVSWTNRVGIEPLRRVDLWQPVEAPSLTYTLVGRSDLIAGKFRALIDRVAARDVFDAIRIAESFDDAWPPPAVKNAFVFLTGTLDHPLTTYSANRVDALRREDVVNNLQPMLLDQRDLDFDELVATAKQVLAPLFILEDRHQVFLEKLHAGELAPEELFPGEVGERLKRHPHLLWKVHNVREHLKGKQ